MADTYDLVTLDEAKNAIKVKSAVPNYDIDLAEIVTAASQRIVDLCGPVVTRTFTNEMYDGGAAYVVLRNVAIGPLAATTVTSLVEYDGAGNAKTLTAEDFDTKPDDAFLIEPETGIVFRRSRASDYNFASGRRNVVFTYASGRAASTAVVPAKFKSAAETMIAFLWRERGPRAGAYRTDTESGPIFGVAPFATPNAVVDMLSKEIKYGGLA